MTKRKPQTRSAANGKMQKGDHTLNQEIHKLTGRVEATQIKSNEVLPSGGLAIPQHVGNASKSTATTPGMVTPTSGLSTPGGYFAQFEDFSPQVDAGFVNNFNKLRIQENWSKEEAARQRNEAIEVEFAHMFGTEYHNVTKWQDLCRLVGLETEGLTSITKCKKALNSPRVMVNLVNLVDHLKNGMPLMKFESFRAFRRYTLKPGRCLNRALAKKNAFVRAMLRHIA